MEHTDENLRAFAAQLSRPEGELGMEVAREMGLKNAPMIKAAVDSLQLSGGERILEPGHGGGSHIPGLMSKAADLHYTGLEISELMHTEAQKFVKDAIAEGRAAFHLYTGDLFPFSDGLFDRIMTVNTLYFWKEPQTVIREMHRVLRPGGSVHISFGQEKSMAQMPFIQYGFQLYDTPKLAALLDELPWKSVRFEDHADRVEMDSGHFIEREFSVAVAEK